MAQKAGEAAPQVKASARFVRMSPFKVREVAQLIRGKRIDEARRILAFTPKAASREISKVLESAAANAEHNFQIPQDELFVKLAYADEGLTIKRFRPRAQGRAYRIRKRTAHINILLQRLPEEVLAQPERRRRPQGQQAKPAGEKARGRRTSAKAGE